MRMWLLYPILLTLLTVRGCSDGLVERPMPTAGPMYNFFQRTYYHIHSSSSSNCVPYGTPISLTMMIQPQGTITITHMELEISANFPHKYRWTDPLTEVQQLLPLALTHDSPPLTITTRWAQEDMPQQTEPWFGAFIELHAHYSDNFGQPYQGYEWGGYIGIDQYTYKLNAEGGLASIPCDQL